MFLSALPLPVYNRSYNQSEGQSGQQALSVTFFLFILLSKVDRYVYLLSCHKKKNFHLINLSRHYKLILEFIHLITCLWMKTKKNKLKSKKQFSILCIYCIYLRSHLRVKFNNHLELHFGYSHVFYIAISSFFFRPHIWIFINPCGFVFDLL